MQIKKNIEPIPITEEFWYMLNNGYINIEDVLEDEGDMEKIKEAIKTINRFESALEDADMLEEI